MTTTPTTRPAPTTHTLEVPGATLTYAKLDRTVAERYRAMRAPR